MNNNAWFKKEMPLQTVIGLGGGATGFAAHSSSASKLYVDDVFSTYLYEGNSGSQTIDNGIDFSGEGGLLWLKNRTDSSTQNILTDTVRGANEVLYSDANNGQATSNMNQSFNDNGWSMNCSFGDMNQNSKEYASWSFRKAPGFFDIVTYTGNGTAGTTVSHNLGCVPGMIILKSLDSSSDWVVGHRHLDSSIPWQYRLQLDSFGVRSGPDSSPFNYVPPTSTEFTLGNHDRENKNGDTFVAYLFADVSSTETTSRSVYFDGSSDYLLSTSSDYSPGTGDFTMEAWVNIETGVAGTDGIYQLSSTSGAFTYGGIALLYKKSGLQNRWELYGGNGTNQSESTTFTGYEYGQWVHTAIVKTGGYIKLYINGEERISAADTQNYSGYQYLGLGAAFSSSYNFKGNISNFKLTIGQALYTSAFTPTNVPLTTTSQSSTASNVKILCCNNSSVTGKTVGDTITSNGTVTASTDNPNFIDPAASVFGDDEDQGIIKMGNYLGNGSSTGPNVNLGFEPQFLIIKESTDSGNNWRMYDSMRGITTGNDAELYPSSTDEEDPNNEFLELTPTGFKLKTSDSAVNDNNQTYIYMAIRRPDGYVAKPAAAGTSVFSIDVADGSTDPSFISNFPVDFSFYKTPASGGSWYTGIRLMGTKYVKTDTNSQETNSTNFTWDHMDGWRKTGLGSSWQAWMWKRYAGCDVVTYTGNGESGHRINHSLSKAPQMIWIKNRTTSGNTGDWMVGHEGLNGGSSPWNEYLVLNKDQGEYDDNNPFNNVAPTTTQLQLSNWDRVNANNSTYVAFLFASVESISKVGYFDGSNSDLTITTGFSPRFLIVKAASTSGQWNVLDTTRGWASGNDPYLKLNSDVAQISGYDNGVPTATGFTLAGNNGGFNVSGQKYIYYAHA